MRIKILRRFFLISVAVFGSVSLLIGADVPEASPPQCVSCPDGYHCVHNPEGCEADNPPAKDDNSSK